MRRFLVLLLLLACRRADDTAAPGKPEAPTTMARTEPDAAPGIDADVSAMAKVTFDTRVGAATVVVTLARSEPERERGLMFVRHLPGNQGMLFLFDEEDEQTFWMKNTLIPLDMIFIRADMTVAGVVENAEPQTLTPRTVGIPSQYVLEVNGGWARYHGVTAGTHVTFTGVAP